VVPSSEQGAGVEERAADRSAVVVSHEKAQLAQTLKQLPKVGTKFLGFHLIAELGRGGSGKVYLAQQGDLAGRYVALKVSADIFDESQALAQLQHTNVVPIYSIHRVKPFLAVCMPYFGSTTLADAITSLMERGSFPATGAEVVRVLFERKGALRLPAHSPWLAETQTIAGNTDTAVPREGAETPAAVPARMVRPTTILEMLKKIDYVKAVIWIASRLSEGLAHAHERGILHLDLKPANILLTDEGQPMLLDFNMARDTKRCPQDEAHLVGGTLPYMSPEQLCAFVRDGKGIDGRSDLYSLGVIMYELLTRRSAFPVYQGPREVVVARMIADRMKGSPRLRCWNPSVSWAVESIIRHCLEPEPARRYQSAAELIEDLQYHLHDLPLVHAVEPSLWERSRKWIRRHPRLVSSTTIIAVEAALVCVFSGIALHRRHQQAIEIQAGREAPPAPPAQTNHGTAHE
jgi:serine/threonine protein kinase